MGDCRSGTVATRQSPSLFHVSALRASTDYRKGRYIVMWRLSYRRDPLACEIMDRHYSRQVIGCGQVGGNARLLVLTAASDDGCALWITSWSRYDKHDWPGAWNCSVFRNEGAGRSSKLIRQAVAATRQKFGEPPENGMITFVDDKQTQPKEHPGHSFIIAGFRPAGMTKNGLHVLQMLPDKMPKPEAPIEFQWVAA